MRSVVYGGCVEPEGYALEDVAYEDVCPARAAWVARRNAVSYTHLTLPTSDLV